MELTNQIHPTPEQIQTIIKEYPAGQPVVMINLLRYKDKTGNGEETGEAAYARYGQNVLPFMKKVGARLLWRGDVKHTVIGTAEGQPHVMLLVEYPSIQKFIEMTSDPAYLKAAEDRTLGLEYGGLMASTTVYKGA